MFDSNEILLPKEIMIHCPGWTLIKNPDSLINIGSHARGLIVENGDLYLENFSCTIHHDIIGILFSEGILKGTFSRNWTRKLPLKTGFLTVQRYGDTSVICIGESNSPLYTNDDYNKHIHAYIEYIEEAKKTCPGLHFSEKLVRIKSLKKGDPEVVFKDKG